MADAVTAVTLVDGPRHAVMHFTGKSDGTGETGVLKVDVSALSGSPSEVSIVKIEGATSSITVDVLWDATTDVVAARVPSFFCGTLDWTEVGGLHNTAGSGKTGDILFTTYYGATPATAGETYDLTIYVRKH